MSTANKVLMALESYGLKKEGSNQYRCKASPFRPGSDSESFTLVIDDDEHGAWQDRAAGNGAGTSGSLYELAEYLGIATNGNGRVAIESSKRVYTGLEDYAEHKAVPAQIFIDAGCYLGEHNNRKAIIIPTKNGEKARFLDGDKPTYKPTKTGYSACFYGLERAIAMATEQNAPLTFTNGETSVIVAQYHGIPAFSTTGGEKRLPVHLVTELKRSWQGEIIIALDCDKVGQNVTGQLVEQIPNAKPVDLMLTDGGDLADLCKLYTDKTMDRLIELTQAPSALEVVPVDPLIDLTKALRELTAANKQDAPDVAKTLDKVQALVDKAKQEHDPINLQNSEQVAISLYEEIKAARENPNKIQGLTCQIPKLDELIGGFQSHRIYTIQGDTHMGKTALGVSLACEFIRQAPGLIVPSEMHPRLWLRKMAARESRITEDQIGEGRLSTDELRRVEKAAGWLADCKLLWLAKGGPSIKDIEAAIQQAIKEYDIKWVLLDSLSNVGNGNGSIYEDTRMASKGTQRLAHEYPVAFIQTVQIGRSVKDRANKNPTIHDSKGGGDIEQDTDVLIGLYNHHAYVRMGVSEANPDFPEGMVVARINKNRQKGTLGQAAKLRLIDGVGMWEASMLRVDLSA